MKNYWIIGDIHGEIALLDELLRNIGRFEPDLIVFVGDYIDRGAHVKEVIDKIMNMRTNVVCLMGNHEMMMLNAMEDMGYGGSPIELWYYNGGEATMHSFGFTSFFNFQSQMESRYLDFFQNLEMCHCFEPVEGLKILVTHAGISPAIPLSDQIGMNNYRDLNRYLLERHIDPTDSFLWTRDAFFGGDPSWWDGYLVVHGHTPVMKLKRFVASGGRNHFFFADNDLGLRKGNSGKRIVSIDIDSGSTISGRLSSLGFFVEDEGRKVPGVRMRSLTVSREDIFPRDMGLIKI
ncbi:MAG: serine/threonine protein phosphatase [Bacteroidetes bacterium]|nr:serine/threonine protein phosphatase [Bacteroidota bacterium]